MNRFKMHLNALPMLLVVAILALGGVIAASFSPFIAPSHSAAEAQSYGVIVRPNFNGSITTETTIGTAPGTTHWNLLAADIMSTSTGSVVLRDGTGGPILAQIPLAANSPRSIADIFASGGIQMSTQVLTATLSGATLTVTFVASQK